MASAKVEKSNFDCGLFGFKVGRIDLESHDVKDHRGLQSFAFIDELRTAEHDGYRLVYLLSPKYQDSNKAELSALEPHLPGVKVDLKTTYMASMSSFNEEEINAFFAGESFQSSSYEIRPHTYDSTLSSPKQSLSSDLRDLALASGAYSRFAVDEDVPHAVYAELFTAWIQNSINRTLVDDVILAIDKSSGQEIGMITVKRKQPHLVDIGLLAVNEKHRRKGIASALLKYATLWAFKHLEVKNMDVNVENVFETKVTTPSSKRQLISNACIQVVTQGANDMACRTYEKFGFTLDSIQIVNHVWLPEDLLTVRPPRADRLEIPYCRQFLTGNEKKYVDQILDNKMLDSAANYTNLCASRIKKLLNNLPVDNDTDAEEMERRSVEGESHSKEVIITQSGTAALEMAAILCGVSTGDEVIMPSFTFTSTANAFVLRGAVPVFVDIRSDTLNIDEKLIEAAITPKTKVICVVHYAGVPCEMDIICDIATRHNLLIVEDAAQAFLSQYKGRQVGTIGDFGCFSFHYTKNIICGEGGALSVNKSSAMRRSALILWEKGTNRCEFMEGKIDKYEWLEMGASYVPSEICSAILWAQLEECENITIRRLKNFYDYMNGLREVSHSSNGTLIIPTVPEMCKNNAHIFFVVLPSVEKRIQLQDILKAQNISAFTHYVPLHIAPAGRKYCRIGAGSEEMKVTNYVFNGLLRLPVWVGLKEDQLKKIISTIKDAIDSM